MKLNVAGKLFLILLAVLAVRMAGRAVRRNAEVMAALWVLLGMTAAVSTAGTAKSRSTEDRLNTLIPQVFPNTGGTISGSVTVAGNHNVGGTLNGPGGSGTLTIGTPAHVNGNGMTVDGAFTTHNALNADGSLSVGGNASVSGNHSVGGALTGGGGSGSTLTIGSPTHVSGAGMTTDGTFTSHGGVSADGNIHAGGTIGGSNFSGSYAGGQAGVSTVTGSGFSANETILASAINGIIARLESSGLIG